MLVVRQSYIQLLVARLKLIICHSYDCCLPVVSLFYKYFIVYSFFSRLFCSLFYCTCNLTALVISQSFVSLLLLTIFVVSLFYWDTVFLLFGCVCIFLLIFFWFRFFLILFSSFLLSWLNAHVFYSGIFGGGGGRWRGGDEEGAGERGVGEGRGRGKTHLALKVDCTIIISLLKIAGIVFLYFLVKRKMLSR